MFIKTSIRIKSFADSLSSNLGFVQFSKTGGQYLPVNISISTNETMNGNNVKLSIWKGKGNNEPPTFIGEGKIDPQVIIDFAEQLKSQGYGKSSF